MDSKGLWDLHTAILAKAEEHKREAAACARLAEQIYSLAIKSELAEDAAKIFLNRAVRDVQRDVNIFGMSWPVSLINH